MSSSGMLRLVALVRTDVSKTRNASIGELGKTLAVPNNRRSVRCHPDDGGATFLRDVGSYKSHTE
jgi:hypothetical protein